MGTDHIKRKKHKRTCIGEIVLAEPASRSWVGFQYCPYLAQRERRQDLQEYIGTELALATSMLVHHAADTTDSGGGGIFFSPFQIGLSYRVYYLLTSYQGFVRRYVVAVGDEWLIVPRPFGRVADTFLLTS